MLRERHQHHASNGIVDVIANFIAGRCIAIQLAVKNYRPFASFMFPPRACSALALLQSHGDGLLHRGNAGEGR